jgi:lipopolysaccharide assembly protein A
VQVLRTIVWVTLVILVLLFILFNVGNTADLNVWPQVGEEPPVIVTGPIWAFALSFLLVGFLPIWLLYRAQSWRLKRRIASLENSLRAAAAVAPVEKPAAPAVIEAPGPEPEPALGVAIPPPESQESKRPDVS